FRKPNLRGKTVPQVIDNAITATMSRTIITHGSTEAMVLSMLILGGPALHGFAMALTIGIVFGIYSSVLVASPLLLMFGVTRENMVKPVRVKEEAVV
ncbi:MAG TPA: protein translocase subunit SecF, partial [Chitinolyticbacter sp.]|nr:protein translocase subunit SecF [Chitinolyticbacter sp.]